jgi:hypothetical protein
MSVESVTQSVSNLALQFGDDDADPGAMVMHDKCYYTPNNKVVGGILVKVKIVKNERDPPLFTGKLLIKFQNILRNTTQVIIRHRVKILFSVISSPITLERQK